MYGHTLLETQACLYSRCTCNFGSSDEESIDFVFVEKDPPGREWNAPFLGWRWGWEESRENAHPSLGVQLLTRFLGSLTFMVSITVTDHILWSCDNRACLFADVTMSRWQVNENVCNSQTSPKNTDVINQSAFRVWPFWNLEAPKVSSLALSQLLSFSSDNCAEKLFSFF